MSRSNRSRRPIRRAVSLPDLTMRRRVRGEMRSCAAASVSVRRLDCGSQAFFDAEDNAVSLLSRTHSGSAVSTGCAFDLLVRINIDAACHKPHLLGWLQPAVNLITFWSSIARYEHCWVRKATAPTAADPHSFRRLSSARRWMRRYSRGQPPACAARTGRYQGSGASAWSAAS